MKLLWWSLVFVLFLGCKSNDTKRDPGLIYDLRGYIRPDSIKYPVGKTITVKYWLTNVAKKEVDEQILIGSKNTAQPFKGYSFNALPTGEKTTPLELKEAGEPYNGKLSLKPKEEKMFVQNKFVATTPGSYLLSFRLHWKNSKRIPFKPVTIYITEDENAKSTLPPEIEKALATLTSTDNLERGKAKEVILAHSNLTAPILVSYLGDDDKVLRSEAMSLLTKMKRSAGKVLLKGAQDKNKEIRLRCITILKKIGGQEFFIALEYATLRDKDREIRMAALQIVIESFADIKLIPLLIVTLRDRDIGIRKRAISVLQKLTKQNFGFDPEAEAEERRGAILRWQYWWKKKNPNAFR